MRAELEIEDWKLKIARDKLKNRLDCRFFIIFNLPFPLSTFQWSAAT
jgi:hypothetical protein